MTFKAVLLVDAGNTAVKSAWLSASGATGTATGDALLQPASIANAQASPQALCALWSEISTPSGVRPQDTALSWLSVGPAQATESIRKAYSNWAGRPAPQPHVATAEHMLFQSSCRVRNAYEQPAQLGAGVPCGGQPASWRGAGRGSGPAAARAAVTRLITRL